MSVSVKRSRGGLGISVSERASVRVVGEVQVAFLEAIEQQRSVVVDLKDATSVDAAFAQLLISARRYFRDAGVSFEIADPDERIAQTFPGCENWFAEDA